MRTVTESCKCYSGRVHLFIHKLASHTKFDKKDGPVHMVPINMRSGKGKM